MPFTSVIAAFAKQEHAYRTRLAGLMVILTLVLALTILPTFKSQISTSTSYSRRLGLRDLRQRELDECPSDPNKGKPGVCGCGVLDNDTDGDGTLDCKDGCPRDALKTSPGTCGCGVPNTDTDGDGMPDCQDDCPLDARKTVPGVCGCGVRDIDTDGDGRFDCMDECIDNDPYLLSLCKEKNPYVYCGGCAEKYYKVRRGCGKQCQSDNRYCVDYSSEDRYEYVDSLGQYLRKGYNETIILTGADSSNTVWKRNYECDFAGNCVEGSNTLNDGSCVVKHYDRDFKCLECSDE